MIDLLECYGVLTAAWFLFFFALTYLEHVTGSQRSKQIRARLALAAPLWPLVLVGVVVGAFVWLVRTARGGLTGQASEPK